MRGLDGYRPRVLDLLLADARRPFSDIAEITATPGRGEAIGAALREAAVAPVRPVSSTGTGP